MGATVGIAVGADVGSALRVALPDGGTVGVGDTAATDVAGEALTMGSTLTLGAHAPIAKIVTRSAAIRATRVGTSASVSPCVCLVASHLLLDDASTARRYDMEERKVVEKRTEVEHQEEPVAPGTKNINIGSDGSTQIQESGDVVDDPVGVTTVRKETTVEERRSS